MRRILNLLIVLSLVMVGVFGIWTPASAFFFGEVNATAYWTSGFTWTIDKSVTPDTWDLFCGDSGTSQYTISVVKEPVSEAAWVDGVVHIQNTIVDPSAPTEGLAIVARLYDGVLPGGVLIATINVDVSSNPILDILEDGYYPYHFDIPSAYIHASGTYTVEAAYTILNFPGHEGVPWDDIVYATATLPASPVATNGTINVDDTNGGSWPFSDSGSVSYSKTFTCCADEDTYDNTATIRETGQSDDASVTVNCYALEVTKDATPCFTRTYQWKIDKVGDQGSLTLDIGQLFWVNYTTVVSVTGSTDSDWSVTGNIKIENPAPVPAVINSVTDVVSPDIAPVVDFGVSFPYTLAAGGTLEGTYQASLPDASTRTNTATATLQNYSYDYLKNATPAGTTDFSGTANVDFTGVAPCNEVDKCVTVNDDKYGDLGTVCYPGDTPKTFRYSMAVGPYEVCGDTVYQFTNCATFTTNDTEATGSDCWTVNTTVPCQAAKCRITGGGTIGDTTVRHGFELHCNKNQQPNRLEINWGNGERFHLEKLTSATCFYDPQVGPPNPPRASCNTYVGSGTGRYDGIKGATAEWIFTDAGEPGGSHAGCAPDTCDWAKIKITDKNGIVVLEVEGYITFGNQQFHNCTGKDLR